MDATTRKYVEEADLLPILDECAARQCGDAACWRDPPSERPCNYCRAVVEIAEVLRAVERRGAEKMRAAILTLGHHTYLSPGLKEAICALDADQIASQRKHHV